MRGDGRGEEAACMHVCVCESVSMCVNNLELSFGFIIFEVPVTHS